MKKAIVTVFGETKGIELVDLTPAEVAEVAAAQQAETAERPKRTAREKIAEQEARQTSRTIREALIAIATQVNAQDASIEKLADIESKIQTQRAIIQGA